MVQSFGGDRPRRVRKIASRGVSAPYDFEDGHNHLEATGGRSASLLTVFLPKYSPPLSRNTATASAISAPRTAPRRPFDPLFAMLRSLDPACLAGQRRRYDKVSRRRRAPSRA